MIECGLCGIEITDDLLGECQFVILSQNAGVVMHPWCFDDFEKRIVFISTAESDQRSVIEGEAT